MIAVAVAPLTERDPIRYGKFVGLLAGEDRGEDVSVVIQLDGHGMMLSLIHPSRVVILPQVKP